MQLFLSKVKASTEKQEEVESTQNDAISEPEAEVTQESEDIEDTEEIEYQ